LERFRHRRPSPSEIITFRFENWSFDAETNQNLSYKVAEAKRVRHNSDRREKRTQRKLAEARAKFENSEMVNHTLQEHPKESAGRHDELKQDIRCFTTKFRSRVLQEPHNTQTAVSWALSMTFPTQPVIYRVKTPDGTMQDWASNIILHLVCVSDVPAANTWAMFSTIIQSLRIEVEGSWIARSADRVVLEGPLAVEEKIVEDIVNNLGRQSVHQNQL
jgi:hypothetical protein